MRIDYKDPKRGDKHTNDNFWVSELIKRKRN